MSEANDQKLLQAFLNSWDKSNKVLVNLLLAVPPGGLEVKATPSSPSVSEMFMHMHHERMVSVSEEAPEFKPKVPEKEWLYEADPKRIAELLEESAKVVRDAVKSRVESGRALDLNFSHPINLIQLLIFHEAYHHGQIKIALKLAGYPITDDVAGPIVWDEWRAKS